VTQWCAAVMKVIQNTMIKLLPCKQMTRSLQAPQVLKC
jgi:hypothetical protein